MPKDDIEAYDLPEEEDEAEDLDNGPNNNMDPEEVQELLDTDLSLDE